MKEFELSDSDREVLEIHAALFERQNDLADEAEAYQRNADHYAHLADQALGRRNEHGKLCRRALEAHYGARFMPEIQRVELADDAIRVHDCSTTRAAEKAFERCPYPRGHEQQLVAELAQAELGRKAAEATARAWAPKGAEAAGGEAPRKEAAPVSPEAPAEPAEPEIATAGEPPEAPRKEPPPVVDLLAAMTAPAPDPMPAVEEAFADALAHAAALEAPEAPRKEPPPVVILPPVTELQPIEGEDVSLPAGQLELDWQFGEPGEIPTARLSEPDPEDPEELPAVVEADPSDDEELCEPGCEHPPEA